MAVDLREALYKVNLNYLKKEPYTGSMDGTRFKLEKISPEEGKELLRLWLWPEPLSFDCTEDEKKSFTDHEFNSDGLEEAVTFIMEFQKGKI